MESYLAVLKNYAGFSGRAGRKEFFMFTLVTTVVSCGLLIIDSILGNVLLYWAYQAAVFLPGAAVAVRRLHDTGRSAWWLLAVVVPIVGGIAVLVFWATAGTNGDNRYGADPKLSQVPQ